MIQFKLWTLVSTNWVDDSMTAQPAFAEFVASSLQKYMRKDWGDTHPDDFASNDVALDPENPSRILAVYNIPSSILEAGWVHDRDGWNPTQVWYITEASRESTCILFPQEY